MFKIDMLVEISHGFFFYHFSSHIYSVLIVVGLLCNFWKKVLARIRAGVRAANLGRPSVYQGGPKFEIQYKSSCLQ